MLCSNVHVSFLLLLCDMPLKVILSTDCCVEKATCGVKARQTIDRQTNETKDRTFDVYSLQHPITRTFKATDGHEKKETIMLESASPSPE